MKFLTMAFAAAGFIGSTTALFADTPVTPAEAEKIKSALEGWNCSGGKMEKETKGSDVIYEVEDAKCRDGEYEIKLDKDFKVIEISREESDTPVTPAEAEKIKSALEGWSCSGGKMEKETKGSDVVYEVEDAKCRDGEYKIKLEKDFKVIEISRD